jgi:hypothetical protein
VHERVRIWQIIGDVRAAVDLGPEDLAVVGADGLLLAGPRAAELEAAAVEYARVRCRADFARVLHCRLLQVRRRWGQDHGSCGLGE